MSQVPATEANMFRLLQESKSTVDFISYINEASPVGVVNAFYGASAPSGWLICDGTSFATATYPNLQAFLGSNTLPDLRGYFLRGLDTTGLIDTQVGRTLKSIQADAFGSHTHTNTVSNGLSSITYTTDEDNDLKTNVVLSGNTTTASTMLQHSHTVTIANTGGLETRGKNVAVNYIIRARKIV